MRATFNRRNLIKTIAAGTAAVIAAPALTLAAGCAPDSISPVKGRIRQSVCQWTYSFMTLEELCKTAQSLGLQAIDLIGPEEWPVLQKYSLDCSMCYTAGKNNLREGFNNPANHEQLIRDYLDVFPRMKAAGYKNVICFSGNRNGMSDEAGLDHCEAGLRKILPEAKKYGITVMMELLNSKVDHKDYMCDRTHWGVALCKRLDSPHFKLLYDIYHMQVQEGDVIRTIRDNKEYIGHYHTAGVPGRNEIGDTQELFYPAIMRAIADAGFTGYVAHEFMPKGNDKTGSLKEAIRICDV